MRSGNFIYKIEHQSAVILKYYPMEIAEETAEGIPFRSRGRQRDNLPTSTGGWADSIETAMREWDGFTESAGTETVVRIPEEIHGFPVREIAPEAFADYGMTIETIEVPSTVERIDDFAFKKCISLTELILHDGVTYLGENILYITAMPLLRIPSTVQYIKNAYELGEYAWEVDEKNPYYSSDGFGLYRTVRGEPIVGASGAHVGRILTAVQKNQERSSYRVAENTRAIGSNAFEGQMYLEEVLLPDTVTIIGEEAFASCQNLKSIRLSSSLQEIEQDAFRGCVHLERLELPASLRMLGRRSVTDTYGWSDRLNGISAITVDEENPYFYADDDALYQKSAAVTLVKYFGRAQTYRIPSNVRRIGESAFRRSNVRELIIPATLKSIGKEAFRECAALEAIYIEADDVQVYVPRMPVYRKDEISALFYTREGRLFYDYAAYDELLRDWSQLPVRCRMACFRLEYPKALPRERRRMYEQLLSEHMEDVITDLCSREDMDYLEALTRCGILTRQNIDEVIELLNRFGKAKLTGYLMEYKQETFGAEEFDFSL